MEEIFHVGREALKDQKQFWEDWIVLLKNKHGDIAGRLLKDAVLYSQGIDGLVHIADESAAVHLRFILLLWMCMAKHRIMKR